MIVRRTQSRRSGVVLIAVLVVITLLSLAAYEYADLMTREYKAADGAARAGQARLFAASGIHYAAALLSDVNSMTGTLNGNPYENTSAFQAFNVNEDASPRYNGYFSIVSPYTVDETSGGTGGNQFRFGVLDEGSKINPNAVMKLDATGAKLREMLMKLPNMTEDVADSIVDWIDADEEARPAGAEATYYSSLSPGYRCKNGPLDSLEELLFVKGVTPDLLFGSDRNRNGSTDGDEQNEGQANDRGWSQYLTVYSRERNIDADGNPRIYFNDTDVAGMYDKMLGAGIPTDVADFIYAFKLYGAYTAPAPQQNQPGQNNRTEIVNSSAPVTKALLDTTKRAQSVSTIFGLVNAKVGISKTSTTVMQSVNVITSGGGRNVTITGQPQTSTVTTITVYNSPLSDPAKAKQYLPILLDKFTTRRDAEIPARVNVNTAPAAVIAALPGITETDAATIAQRRPAFGSTDINDPTFGSVAWLFTEAQISPTTLQALERYITARPNVYRMQSVGYFPNGGPFARIEAVVDTNAGQPRIVYWRDISELGKGFNLQSR